MLHITLNGEPRTVPGPLTVAESTRNMPAAIAARTCAESIATVSIVDVARLAPRTARIVAGSNPRPRANAVAVSNVAGARELTLRALNTRICAVRSYPF